MPRKKKQKKYNIKTNKKTGEVRIYAKGKRGRVSVANAFRSKIFREEIKSLKKKDQNLLDTLHPEADHNKMTMLALYVVHA